MAACSIKLAAKEDGIAAGYSACNRGAHTMTWRKVTFSVLKASRLCVSPVDSALPTPRCRF